MVKFGSHYYALVKVTALSYLSLSVQALQVTTGRATSVFRDSHCSVATDASTSKLQSRRNVIDATAFSLSLLLPSKAYATGNLSELLAELKKARLQMEPIPDLINTEQWDAVRAILILPPLSNLWTKSARKVPLLQEYADIIGGNNGDELAVLEGKEELMSSLRVSFDVQVAAWISH
jgi:hypothetical protein